MAAEFECQAGLPFSRWGFIATNSQLRRRTVNMNSARNLLRAISLVASLGLVSIVVLGQTSSQNAAPKAAGAPAAQLTPYTAPDKSVSVGVPPGWKVTKSENGVVQMSGPQGESISLGNGVFVHNGPFQAGQQSSGLVSLSMPYSATLNQKYVMIWQQAAATSGKPTPQVKFISATPIPLAKNIAECSVYLGTMTTAEGTSNFESRFCSLPPDPNGIFKLFWMNASIPAALAAQERATAEAVLSSYKLSLATLQLLLKPLTQALPPPAVVGGGGGGGGMSPGAYAERMSEESATCMDEGVIREEPERDLPSYCH
jgi:hypothetical protein